jgi:hypothetical protein
MDDPKVRRSVWRKVIKVIRTVFGLWIEKQHIMDADEEATTPPFLVALAAPFEPLLPGPTSSLPDTL